jgi:hypothetical protein
LKKKVETAKGHRVVKTDKDKILIIAWQGSLKILLGPFLTRDFQTKEFLTLMEQLLHLLFFKEEIQQLQSIVGTMNLM